MIEMDGMGEDELIDVLNFLLGRQRHVAFAGDQVKSLGGMGRISHNLRFGPMVRGRVIATYGAPYTIVGDSYGQSCCPHFCSGTIIEGAQDVVYQGQPVVMVGHKGRHHHICDSQRGTAVAVEGWRANYVASRDYGLEAAAAVAPSGLGSHNIDQTIAFAKRMGTRLDD